MACGCKGSPFQNFSRRGSTEQAVIAKAKPLFNALKIYCQNMGGIRSKSGVISTTSGHLDYDIFIFVETWLNHNFYDDEYFDSNLYDVFRKDRDIERTGCSLGGGVLIAVRRNLQAYLVTLKNEDLILDQLCVCVQGSSGFGSLYLLASYIPPRSNFDLYKAHTDNIVSLVQNKLADNQICIFGDFNLPEVMWSNNFSNFGLIPNNITTSLESYVIDNILSNGLVQINNFVNNLGRILDLVFVSDNINISVSQCVSTLAY